MLHMCFSFFFMNENYFENLLVFLIAEKEENGASIGPVNKLTEVGNNVCDLS